MRKLMTLLTLTILAASLLAGCGEKPGAPTQVSVAERRNDATADAANDNPIAQSEMVRSALKDNSTYHDQIMKYEPKEGQGLPESGATPAANPANTTDPAATPADPSPAENPGTGAGDAAASTGDASAATGDTSTTGETPTE